MVAMIMAVVLAAVGIGNVQVQQNHPWDGKVNISYTVTGDIGDIDAAAAAKGGRPQLVVQALDKETSTKYEAATLSGDKSLAEGTHDICWDMSGDRIAFKSTNVVFAVLCKVAPARYMVVDLSNPSAYPVTTLDDVPGGGWTDEYKTSKLVLRYIENGTFTMGDQVHVGTKYSNITISRGYYVGVFEVTQRQWELVKGTKPSYFNNATYYQTRPVEEVSYNMIRGNSKGAGWPGSSEVDDSSFLGVLRAKTGNNGFDLPTEAQWEFAARSGTTTDYGNGTCYSNSGQDANMAVVGRYWYNGGQNYSKSGDTSVGTAKVGSYAPNRWGLYDMHGNVWEWCLDWYGSLSSGATDPKGAGSGPYRVQRGGCWDRYADYCTSSFRNYYFPSDVGSGCGFRVCCSAGSFDSH